MLPIISEVANHSAAGWSCGRLFELISHTAIDFCPAGFCQLLLEPLACHAAG